MACCCRRRSKIADEETSSNKPASAQLTRELSQYTANLAEDKPGWMDIRSKYYPQYAAGLPTMEGKVVAITGCTTGTGHILARTMLEKKATVVLLNRPSSRAKAALEKFERLARENNAPMPVAIPCDLASFASVRTAGEELLKAFGETGIDVLCNNAGIMAFPDEATVDGCDIQMQTNHTSHFLLTKYVMPCLETAAVLRGEARVVNHASVLRAMNQKDWDNHLKARYLDRNGGSLGGNSSEMMKGPNYQRYQQSKLANVVFTYALHDRLEAAGSKVKALVAHPGVAPTALHMTAMVNGDSQPAVPWCCLKCVMKKAVMQSEEDGTMGLLMCSCDPSAQSGQFYGPYGKGLHGGVHDTNAYRGPAVLLPQESLADGEARKILWGLSEKVTGATFSVREAV